ncbi:hypothetical protein DB804_24285, partial [Xanthomonas perforans]
METIIVLVALVLLAVPVGVVIALVWMAGLRRRVAALEQRLAQWQRSGAGPADAPAQAPADAQAGHGNDRARRPLSALVRA